MAVQVIKLRPANREKCIPLFLCKIGYPTFLFKDTNACMIWPYSFSIIPGMCK